MPFEIVAVGASWGGLQALGTVLAALPPDYALPIVVAQHRSADGGDDMLERALARDGPLEVVAVTDKEPLEPGRVYVAPPGYHAIVEPGHLALDADEPVQFARPSIDVLFESAAGAYGARTVGVLLTGMNEDGAAGLATIAAVGGFTVVQDPATAARAQMPEAAIARGAAKRVLPLDEIGPFLAGIRTGVAP